MSGNRRYYSQSYELVDEPEAAHSHGGFDDQYTSYDGPRQQDAAYEPYRQQESPYQLPSYNTDIEREAAHPHAAAVSRDVSRGPSPIYDDDYNSLKQRLPQQKSSKFAAWKGGAGAWWSGQSKKRKYIYIGGVVGIIVLLIIIIGVAAGLASDSYDYTPSYAHVTNETSFETGGATRDRPQPNSETGAAEPQDVYTYYSGPASNFPTSDKWISFDDMWSRNLNTFKTSCGYLNEGPDNTDSMIQDIYDAIQDRANASFVDHRYILATILQESNGCPRVGHTTSSSGVRNPGLMQSHNGHAFDSSHVKLSILQMIQDGTQGTENGDGLVQNLDMYGDPYSASRGYNSGYIPESGDLSEASGATACYVTDIANRLTGWVKAKSTCPGDE